MYLDNCQMAWCSMWNLTPRWLGCASDSDVKMFVVWVRTHLIMCYIKMLFSSLFLSYKATPWNWCSLLPATMNKGPCGVHLSHWGYGTFFPTRISCHWAMKWNKMVKYESRLIWLRNSPSRWQQTRKTWQDARDSTCSFSICNINYGFPESVCSLELGLLLASILSVWVTK